MAVEKASEKKEVKKTSKVAEKKEAPSAASSLKKGLEAPAKTAAAATPAKEAPAKAASVAPVSEAAKPSKSGTATTPAARDAEGDQWSGSPELDEQRRRMALGIPAITGLREAFGTDNAETARKLQENPWTHKISDILTGSSGRLRNALGLSQRLAEAREAQRAKPEQAEESKNELKQAVEQLRNKNSPESVKALLENGPDKLDRELAGNFEKADKPGKPKGSTAAEALKGLNQAWGELSPKDQDPSANPAVQEQLRQAVPKVLENAAARPGSDASKEAISELKAQRRSAEPGPLGPGAGAPNGSASPTQRAAAEPAPVNKAGTSAPGAANQGGGQTTPADTTASAGAPGAKPTPLSPAQTPAAGGGAPSLLPQAPSTGPAANQPLASGAQQQPAAAPQATTPPADQPSPVAQGGVPKNVSTTAGSPQPTGATKSAQHAPAVPPGPTAQSTAAVPAQPPATAPNNATPAPPLTPATTTPARQQPPAAQGTGPQTPLPGAQQSPTATSMPAQTPPGAAPQPAAAPKTGASPIQQQSPPATSTPAQTPSGAAPQPAAAPKTGATPTQQQGAGATSTPSTPPVATAQPKNSPQPQSPASAQAPGAAPQTGVTAAPPQPPAKTGSQIPAAAGAHEGVPPAKNPTQQPPTGTGAVPPAPLAGSPQKSAEPPHGQQPAAPGSATSTPASAETPRAAAAQKTGATPSQAPPAVSGTRAQNPPGGAQGSATSGNGGAPAPAQNPSALVPQQPAKTGAPADAQPSPAAPKTSTVQPTTSGAPPAGASATPASHPAGKPAQISPAESLQHKSAARQGAPEPAAQAPVGTGSPPSPDKLSAPTSTTAPRPLTTPTEAPQASTGQEAASGTRVPELSASKRPPGQDVPSGKKDEGQPPVPAAATKAEETARNKDGAKPGELGEKRAGADESSRPADSATPRRASVNSETAAKPNSGSSFGEVRDGFGNAAGNASPDRVSRAADQVAGKASAPDKSSAASPDAERRQGEQAAALQGAQPTPAQATPANSPPATDKVDGVGNPTDTRSASESSAKAPVSQAGQSRPGQAVEKSSSSPDTDAPKKAAGVERASTAGSGDKKEAGFIGRFMKASGSKLQDRLSNASEPAASEKRDGARPEESKQSDGGLLGTLRAKANDVKEGIGGKVNDLKDAAGNTGRKVSDKVSDVKDAVGDTARKVGDKVSDVKDAVGDTAKKVGDKVSDVKDGVGDTAKKVGDKAKDVQDAVADRVKDGAEKVGDAKNAAGDKLKDEAGKAKDAGADVLDKARDTAGEQLSKAGETIGGPIGTAIDNLGREVQGEQNRAKDRDQAINDLSRNLTDEQRDKVERALQNHRLDSDILKDIAMDKSSIEAVKSDDPRLRDENGNPRAGFYDADTDKIYIAENTFKNQDKLDKVLYDEIGHRIDDRLRENRATSNGWSDMVEDGLREERKNPRLDENARKNREEFASEAISDYLRGGDQAERLREAHPELFQTIRQTVGEGDRGRVADWRDTIGALSPLSGGQDSERAERFRRNQLSGIHHSDSALDQDRGARHDRDRRDGDRNDSPPVANDRPAPKGDRLDRVAPNRDNQDQPPAVQGDKNPPAKSVSDAGPAPKNNTQTPGTNNQGTATPRPDTQGTTTPRSETPGTVSQPGGMQPLAFTGSTPTATLASLTGPGTDPLLSSDNQQPRTPPVEPQNFKPEDPAKAGDGTTTNNLGEPGKQGPPGSQTGKPDTPATTNPNPTTQPSGRQDPPGSQGGKPEPLGVKNPAPTTQPSGTQAGKQDPPGGTQPTTAPSGTQAPARPTQPAGDNRPTAAPSGTQAPARPTPPSGGTPTSAPSGTQAPARPTQPAVQQPAPTQPARPQPTYQQPAPQQPTYQQPAYQQPARGGGGYGGYGGGGYSYGAPAAFSPAINPLSTMLNPMMSNDFGASLLQGSLGDMTQLNQLGMAQQELMKLDQSLLQNPALGELEKISQGLQGLDKLPQALQGLEQLKDIAPTLEKMPQTLDGLNNVQRMMDKVKDLPASAKDLSRSPELRQMMRDLPQTNQKLQGLTELAKSGPQLPGQLQGLQQVKQVGETLQNIGQQAEKLHQLPTKLDQVAQAVPALRAGSAESHEPLTKADGRPNTGTRVEIAQGGQIRQRLEAPVRTDGQGDQRGQHSPRGDQQPMPRDQRDPQRRADAGQQRPIASAETRAPGATRPEAAGARPETRAPGAARPEAAGARPETPAVRPNQENTRPAPFKPAPGDKLSTPPSAADKMLVGKQPGADNLPVPGRENKPPVSIDKAPHGRQPGVAPGPLTDKLPATGTSKPPAALDHMPNGGAPKPPAMSDKMPMGGAPKPPGMSDKMPIGGAPKPPAMSDKMPIGGGPKPPAMPDKIGDKMPLAGAPKAPAGPDRMTVGAAPKPAATTETLPNAGLSKPPVTPSRVSLTSPPPKAPLVEPRTSPSAPGKPGVPGEQPNTTARQPLNPARNADAARPAGPAANVPGKQVANVSLGGPVARPPLAPPARSDVPAAKAPIETPVAKAPPAADVKVPWMEHGPRADAPMKARRNPEVTSTGGVAPQVRVQNVSRPATSTGEVNPVDTRVSQRLQKAPVMARKLEQLPQAQKQLNQAVSSLEKATRPENMQALQKTAADPQSLNSGLDRLAKLVSSPQDKAALAGLRRTLEPVLGDAGTRKGLQQVNEALKPLSKQDLHALRNVKLDTSGTRKIVQQLTQPGTRQQVERVSQGLSNAQELQRATQAQQNRLAAKPETSAPADLSDSLAKIVQDAQAANRPRSLFGIPLGGGAARGGAGVAPAGGGAPAAPNAVRGAAPAARAGVAPLGQTAQPAAPQTHRPGQSAAPKAQAASPASAAPAAAPAQAQPQPQPQTSSPAARGPQPPRETLSKPRLDSYRQSYDIMRDQMIGKAGKDHAWALVYHTRDAEGAKGVADTLESTVTKGGSAKMQSWLNDMTKNPDSATALSAILANVGTATPDRMVGILLLTTDGEGGKETVANAFHKMSANVDSSLRLAHFLEATSRHPNAGRGVAELLDGMTEPKGESWQGATQAAETFKNMSETVGGSRRLTQTLENLGELEGGNRLVARTLNRMARTTEGAQSTLDTLQNLAHDKEGAGQLGKVLARASESRDGARDILGSLQKMSAKPAGKQDVGRLLVRLAEGGQGARLLANWAKDGNNAGHLTQLFDQLSQNNESRQLLGHALDLMAKNPRQRAQYEVFAGRAAMSDSLQAAIDYATKSEVRSALGGAESTTPSTKSRWDETEEPAELRALRHQPQRVMETGEVAETQQQLRKATDLAGVSEVWRTERAAVTSEAAAVNTTQATASPERAAEQPPEPKSFRPGDVYSQETLRHAKICPECGGRTTSLGWCPGCSARQQQKQAQATSSI